MAEAGASQKIDLAQQALLSGDPRRATDAVRLAQEALKELPPGAGKQEVARVHTVLGEALLATGEATKALGHLEQGLDLLRPEAPSAFRCELRIRLAMAYLLAGRQDDAAFQLERTREEARQIGSARWLAEAARLLAQRERQAGRIREAVALLRSAERDVEGTPWETVLAVERLEPRLYGEPVEKEFVALVRRFVDGALPRHPEVDAVMQRILANSGQELPEELRERLLQPDLRKRVGVLVQARLLGKAGQQNEALHLLRHALAEARTDGERLNAASMLLVFLPERATEEIRRTCEVIEPLLEGAFDNPYTRSDLAEGFRRCAQGDHLILDRAWRHAQRAAKGLGHDPEALVFNAPVRALIRMTQLGLGAQASTPAQIALASWFEQLLPLPPAELARFRREASGALLHPGPFTHPDALALAARLLTQVPDSSGPQAIWARLKWVSASLSGTGVQPAPADKRGPWDGAPAWAIRLAQGQRPSPSNNTTEALAHLVEVMKARPDRQSACLDWLFESISCSTSDSDGFDTVHFLAALSPRGAIGPELLEGLERAIRKNPTFSLLRLRFQLLFQMPVRGDRAPALQAANELLSAARAPLERIEAKYFKGAERLTSWSSLPPLKRQQGMLEEARKLLSEAVDEEKTARAPGHLRFALWVTAGNAFRQGGEADVERALELYGQAEALGAVNEFEAAKLWKVMADALVERNGLGDDAKALALIEKALGIRREGYLRAETLLTASKVELMQKERSEPERLTRAMTRLEEALRHDDGTNRLGYAYEIMSCISRLLRHAPRDQGLLRRLDELSGLDPELAKVAERARRGWIGILPEEMAESLIEVIRHPSGALFLESTRPLKPLDEALLSLGMDPEDFSTEEQRKMDSAPVERTPEALRARVDRLAEESNPERRPGALTAHAVILAHLAECGKATASETIRAADEAERLVRRMNASDVRRFLLMQLAQVWAPQDTQSHPVRDFTRAAQLCREVLSEFAPGDPAALDVRQRLARATLYRTDGDRLAHLREAEQLFEECITGYDALGMKDGAAHLRQSLAQLRSVLRRGGSEAAYHEGVRVSRERLETVQAPGERAEAQAALAIDLTRLGSEIPGPEGDQKLKDAKRTFESLEWERLPLGMRFDVENYKAICRAESAWRAGHHEAAIGIWKERLVGIDRIAHPVRWAMTVHNLADMMLRIDPRTGGINPHLLHEGIALCEQALQVRTLEEHSQFHWETCDTLGRAIAWTVSSIPVDAPERGTTWERGERALLSALKAARRIGGGERLGKSAFLLMQLASTATAPAKMEETAEAAWKAIDEARPYLLLDESSGAMEAVWSIRLAMLLGRELARAGTGNRPEEFPFLLTGETAEKVLRWMARGIGAAQRRLAGRTARPAGVSHDVWVNWLAAVRSGEPGELARAAEQVQSSAPSFLRGEPDLSETLEWLRARPGSVTIALAGKGPDWLVAILECAEKPKVQIVALRTETLTLSEEDVARELSVEDSGQPYRDLLAWAERNVVEPLRRVLPATPSHILWIPGGPLRLLAPSDLWPSMPVTLATNVDLTARSRIARPQGTLVTVADPGPGAEGELKAAVKIGEQFARRVAGNARLLMSRGKAFGKRLRVSHPGLVNYPASPDEVLRQLAEVDVVVFLCHGAVLGPADARLVLVDEGGTLADLGLTRVGEDPQRISGATVILLACDTGRVGEWLHRAAGLAGAFLACGAREVIAPLWEVRLGAAFEVGMAVLDALASGEDLSATLHQLRTGGGSESNINYAGRPWSLKAFVRWVG
jgi:tetratricopeptide (TPR) repeat protein